MGSMCEPLDLSNFAQQDMWYQQLVFEGFQSGVPTNTTPTLTPTTLRTLEQSLINMEADDTSYHNEAGFVPPIVQPTNSAGSICLNVMNPAALQGGSTTVIPSMANALSRPSVVASTINTSTDNLSLVQPMTSVASTSTVRKNVGGRRPTKAQGISPEEEERRQLRRERNKAAAARCRKRRMDQTNSLEIETKGLEEKRQQLQQEIRELTQEKEELEHVLEAHKRAGCKALGGSVNGAGLSIPCGPTSPPDIKPVVPISSAEATAKQQAQCLQIKQEMEMLDALGQASFMNQQYCPTSTTAPPAKKPCYRPPRPTSLNVAAAFTPAQNFRAPSNLSEVAGIPISTPSAGMFNFDSLMEGGTGLTPVSGPLVPSCSSQQRNQHNVGDLSSPDSNISNKLVSL